MKPDHQEALGKTITSPPVTQQHSFCFDARVHIRNRPCGLCYSVYYERMLLMPFLIIIREITKKIIPPGKSTLQPTLEKAPFNSRTPVSHLLPHVRIWYQAVSPLLTAQKPGSSHSEAATVGALVGPVLLTSLMLVSISLCFSFPPWSLFYCRYALWKPPSMLFFHNTKR